MAKIKFIKDKAASTTLKPATISSKYKWKRRAIILLALLLGQTAFLVYLLRVTNSY